MEYKKDSLYRKTGFTRRGYLDVLTDPVGDISAYQTTTVVIDNKYENRPDLLAYELYGNPKVWWVFAFFNQDTLLDPIIDFKAGLELTVPTKFI